MQFEFGFAALESANSKWIDEKWHGPLLSSASNWPYLDYIALSGVGLLLALLGWSRARNYLANKHTAVIHEREEQFRLIMDNLDDLVAVLDLEGRRIYNSPGYSRILGDPAVLNECSFSDIHPEDRPRVEQTFRDTVRTGVGQRLEYRMLDLAGKSRYIESQGSVIRDAQGKVSKVLVVSRDVTQRKRTEEALQESERNYREVFNASPDAIFIHELTTGKILHVNESMLRMYGYASEAEILALKIGDLSAEMPNYSETQIQSIFHDTSLNGPKMFEWHAKRKNGELFWVEVLLRRSEIGGQGRILAMVRDISERKNVEEKTRLLAQRLKLATDAAAIGIWDWNLKTDEWYATPIYFTMLGYNPDEGFSNRDIWIERLHPEDRAAVAAKIRAVLDVRETHYEYEARMRHADGTYRWMHSSGEIIEVDGQGKPVRMIGVRRDVTARKEAEAHIQRLNRIYAVLSDINQAIVRERDSDRMIASACQIAVDCGGFRLAWISLQDPGTGNVRPVASAGVEVSRIEKLYDAMGDRLRENSATARVFKDGVHVLCNDIQRDPLMASWREEAERKGLRAFAVFPLKVEGQIVGTFNLCADKLGFFDNEETRLLDELAMDISFALEVSRRETERRRIEEANIRLATAVEQAAEIIMITDANAAILYVNPAFEKITGFSRQEVIGQNPRILKSGKHDNALYQNMWETIARGEVWAGHTINKKKDGTLYEEETTISPIRDASGAIINYVAVKHDVTQKMALELQLRQSQKMEAVGRLSGGIAHDFNNLLTVIQGHISLIKSLETLPPDLIESAGEIQRAIERGANLTRQLLLFSRQQAMRLQNVDLNDIVNHIMAMLRRILGEDIQMHASCAPQPLILHADAAMLDQVLLNLAINSRDAMPNGGRLTIETSAMEFRENTIAQSPNARPGVFACLSVIDTGCGIPANLLPRIFEPFFTTKDVGKGTGLGLATVFGIIEQHHGWIDVLSEVGRGTEFRIFLPCLDKATLQPSTTERPSVARGGQETILVVEDEPALRTLIRTVLTKQGYRILEAENGRAALEVWNKNSDKISLMLTDLVMPGGMTGMQLAHRLLEGNPQLKVIYTSGYSTEIINKDPSLHEGVNFLSKPFDPARLAQTVRAYLDKE